MVMSYPELVRFKKCTLSLTDTFSNFLSLSAPFKKLRRPGHKQGWQQEEQGKQRNAYPEQNSECTAL